MARVFKEHVIRVLLGNFWRRAHVLGNVGWHWPSQCLPPGQLAGRSVQRSVVSTWSEPDSSWHRAAFRSASAERRVAVAPIKL